MEFELNEKHIEYLKRIKKIRIKSAKAMLSRLFIILFIFFAGPFFYIGYEENQRTQDIYHSYSPFLFIFVAICLITFTSFCILYFKGILPLKEDIDAGKGQKYSLQIIHKSYFPLTNAYYIFFDSKEPENIKLDAVSYSHYQIGDYYSIFKTIYSDVIFEDYERFEVA